MEARVDVRGDRSGGEGLHAAGQGRRRQTAAGDSSELDDLTDRLFRSEFRRTGMKLAQRAFIAGAVLALAFAVLMNSNPERDFNQDARQLIRLALALFFSGSAALLALAPRFGERYYVAVVGIPAAVACFSVASLGFLPTEVDLPRSGRLTIAMCLTCYLIYGFTRLPPFGLLVMCSLASVVAISASVQNGDDYPQALLIYLAVTNASGWILARQIEKRERNLYRKATQLSLEQKRSAASAEASQEASAAKSRVLAAVSHDLRQPLTGMSLYLAALRGNLQSSEVSCQSRTPQLVGQIDECIAAMSDHISRLSCIAELQDATAPFPTRQVNVLALFPRLSSVYAGQAAGKGVRLVVRAPRRDASLVTSDSARLWDVLSNLVSNAIKFARSDGSGWVLVRVVRRDRYLRIVVRDNGVGIAEAHHRRIFDEYFQIGNAARDRANGYGLGLSIVRDTLSRLADHGLRLRSAPGKGTTLEVVVPLSLSCEASAKITEGQGVAIEIDEEVNDAEGRGLHGCYALVIDDDPSTRAALADTLESWGVLVETAGSAEEAILVVRRAERLFDAVVSDFGLPGDVDGLALIEEIRREQDCFTPAILVSGRAESIDPRRLDELQVRLLAKPVESSVLRSELASCLVADATTRQGEYSPVPER